MLGQIFLHEVVNCNVEVLGLLKDVSKDYAVCSVAGKEERLPLTERVQPLPLARTLCEGCSTPFDRLPVVVVADSFGRIVYFSQGYNTSLPSDVQQIISGL